jgi:hypothetical protein
MAAMRPLLLLAAVCAVTAGPAFGATDPRLTQLQTTLKANMVKTFKKQAPSLKITTVSCKLPADGVTSHCKAYFTVSKTKGYYPVVAKLHDLGGKLTWTAQSPQCWNAAKKKYVACNS